MDPSYEGSSWLFAHSWPISAFSSDFRYVLRRPVEIARAKQTLTGLAGNCSLPKLM